MGDPRVAKLARVIVRYSLALKEGDLLQITANAVAAPLLRELYRETLEVGAQPYLRITIDGIDELMYAYGSEKQISFVSKVARQEIEEANALLSIMAFENTKSLSRSDTKKIALRRRAAKELSDRIFQRSAAGELNWCATLFPTQASAQDAEMSLRDYEDFVYGAGKLNADDPVAEWQATHAEQQRLADIMATKKVIRLVAPDTDLTYHTGGRKWINASGLRNFPDGEVFTSPDETKTEGKIRFTYPAVYSGREVQDVRLVFQEGKVVQATAAKGEDLLHSLIDLDDGARRLGEAAFGTNYNIKQFSRNTLFDEKIGGTIHLALGESFIEIDGQNRSALHWDMVCDMRQGGEAYADGELIYKDGKFLI